MATKNPNAKRRRPSTVNNSAIHSTSIPSLETPTYDPDVTNAAVATLVRALLSALRHSLSVAYVSAVALRRQNFDLGIDLAPRLKSSLDGNRVSYPRHLRLQSSSAERPDLTSGLH
jgi:hypothetical protein